MFLLPEKGKCLLPIQGIALVTLLVPSSCDNNIYIYIYTYMYI